jgi:hypothetical protein
VVLGDADERLRERIAKRRPVAVDQRLARQGKSVGESGGGDHEQQKPRPALEEREDERDPDPQEAERPDLREPDEDVVGRAGPVVDDEALELAVKAD